MKRRIKLYDDLYDVHITYLLGGTVEDLVKYIKRKHKKAPLYSWGKQFTFGADADTTNGYQFHVNAPLGNGEVFYIWTADATPYLLFHETYHLVGDILYTRGLPYTYSSEEAYAYLGGWIFEKVFKKLGGKLPKRL